jgi:hypothetical protein
MRVTPRRLVKVVDNGGAAVVHGPGNAAKAKSFGYPAKTVTHGPIVDNIEAHVPHDIGLDGLGHDRERGGAPDQLLLKFAQDIAAAQVVAHDLDKIAKPAGGHAAAVNAGYGKQPGTV